MSTGEIVDLVDADGNVQVVGLPREEACANQDPDLYVPIAVAVVFNGLGQVLVQQRSHRKLVDGGKLDLVCGIVASGEDPQETAARETMEETLVQPVGLRQIAAGVNVYRRYRHLFIGHSDQSGRTVTEANEEVEWAQFMNPVSARLMALGPRYRAVGDFREHLDLAHEAEKTQPGANGLVQRSSLGHVTAF